MDSKSTGETFWWVPSLKCDPSHGRLIEDAKVGRKWITVKGRWGRDERFDKETLKADGYLCCLLFRSREAWEEAIVAEDNRILRDKLWSRFVQAMPYGCPQYLTADSIRAAAKAMGLDLREGESK